MKDYGQRWNVNTMKDVIYIYMNDYSTMNIKKWSMKLYSSTQNLSMCRGPLHQPRATAFKYELRLETESSYILKCSHNREMILQHSGNAITLQSYMEASYYVYENALFITKVI